MRAVGAALAGALAIGSGCTYYNAIYNAEHLYEDAERHRQAGRDSLARAGYADVVRKAGRGYRREPDGGWAWDAAFLLGRAHLRRDDLPAARAALEHAVAVAEDADERLASLIYLGIVEARLGRPERAVARFNEGLAGVRSPAARAEGHLHRGRILLDRGNPDAGWWDLDRAAEHRALRVEATLERLRAGVRLGHLRRAEESVRRLLSYPEAGVRLPAIVDALVAAAERWGPRRTFDLVAGAPAVAWERAARDRLRMEQAELAHRAGLRTEAEALLRVVAESPGKEGAEARLRLAARVLAEADDVGDLLPLRGLLLPASDDARVAARLADLDEVETLVFDGVDRPLAWFAAAEIARDRLRAPVLARGLLLAYAGSARDDPWAPKALLAALALTDDERERAHLRERLEAHPGSPYVLAARGRPAAGFEALEEELVGRLREIRPR